jgi:hypothetical protein
LGSWTGGTVFGTKTVGAGELCQKNQKKLSKTSSRLQEVAGLKGHLSTKTERRTPKGKARKPLFPEEKSVAKGKVFSADKEKKSLERANARVKGGEQ